MVLLRLADRQGVLRGPGISRFQQWALAYLIVDERKDTSDHLYDLKEFLWALMKPDEYRQRIRPASVDLSDGEEYMGPGDFAEIEKFIAELDKPKKITGKELR